MRKFARVEAGEGCRGPFGRLRAGSPFGRNDKFWRERDERPALLQIPPAVGMTNPFLVDGRGPFGCAQGRSFDCAFPRANAALKMTENKIP